MSTPWHVPVKVDEVPETGARFDFVADAATREAVARLAGLRDLPRLEASFDVNRHGAGGLRVAGRVTRPSALAWSRSNRSPMRSTKRSSFCFAGQVGAEGGEGEQQGDPDEAEPLIAVQVDLGALRDRSSNPWNYPRKPGAVFQPPQGLRPTQAHSLVSPTLKKGRDWWLIAVDFSGAEPLLSLSIRPSWLDLEHVPETRKPACARDHAQTTRLDNDPILPNWVMS